jgi:hypothetical protein
MSELTRDEIELQLRAWGEADHVMLNAVQHLKSLSRLTHEWIFATIERSGIGQFDQLVMRPTYLYWWSKRDQKKPARYLASFKGRFPLPASVIVFNGVVMASRGIDNVTDVCEAMRADLARRNGVQS